MIFIGIGANLPSPECGEPVDTCRASLDRLEAEGVAVVRRSRWYRSQPVPASDQPWFVNGVAELATSLAPEPLFEVMRRIEERFGRVRTGVANEARVLDLDLLAHGATVTGPNAAVQVPHPRLHERAFVLRPLVELAPEWRHPALGRTAAELLAAVGGDQVAEPLEPGTG